MRRKVRFRKISAEDCADQDAQALLAGVHGLLVPGGFGERGLEGKIRAIQWARENQVPCFGICFGMQAMVIEFARHLAGIKGAHTSEADPNCKAPVIDLMREQASVEDKGGTMRLGAYPCRILDNTQAASVYGRDMVLERHRHRWEFNNDYRQQLEASGLVCSGVYEARNLVEIVEYPASNFYLGVQYHPEFKSKPLAPHPLFAAFTKAALQYAEAKTSNTPTNSTAAS